MCLLEHRLKHWPEVAGRRIDDPQHLGSGGLLLQGLARLSDQARILHRDHRLPSEILDERDLLVAERARFAAVDPYRTEQRFALAQRDEKAGTHTALFDDAPRAAVFAQIVVTHDVRAVGYLLQRRRRDRVRLQLRNELVRQSALGDRPEARSIVDPKNAGGPRRAELPFPASHPTPARDCRRTN